MNITKSLSTVLGLIIMVATPALSAPAANSTTGPTDRQIAAIVVAANTAEIAAGQCAENTSEDKNVKRFAHQMIKEHKSVNKATLDLISKLKMKAEKNDTSRALDKDGKANLAALKKLTGHAFDKAYVEQEVTGHQAVLDEIDKSLLPNVSNGELRTLLQQTRPAVAAHLEHAQKLAATM